MIVGGLLVYSIDFNVCTGRARICVISTCFLSMLLFVFKYILLHLTLILSISICIIFILENYSQKYTKMSTGASQQFKLKEETKPMNWEP